MKYLLDTNIVIFLFKGKFGIGAKIDEVGIQNCCISEITVAELYYGMEKSNKKLEARRLIEEFFNGISVVPISSSLKLFAKERARLEISGKTIDNFDLLIGATALEKGLIMVTNNVSHFSRIERLKVEDWKTLLEKE